MHLYHSWCSWLLPVLVVALSIIISPTAAVISPFTRQCPAAYIEQCLNGGSIPKTRCIGSMSACTDTFEGTSVCDCPEGFRGIDCSIVASSSSMCTRRTSTFFDDPINPEAATRSHCNVVRTSILTGVPLNLRDTRIALDVDVPGGWMSFKLFGRSKSLLGSSCSKVLELAWCRLSECQEVISPDTSKRTISCAKKECSSCRESGHADRQFCPVLVGLISQLSKSPDNMQMTYGKAVDGHYSAWVQVPIPGQGTMNLQSDCYTGSCFDRGLHTADIDESKSIKLLSDTTFRPSIGESTDPGEVPKYLSLAVACLMCVLVLGAVVRAHLQLLLLPTSESLLSRHEPDADLIESGSRPDVSKSPLFGLFWKSLSIRVRVKMSWTSSTLPSWTSLLEPCDGSVRPGEMVALVGSSGAGKSTLLRLIASAKTLQEKIRKRHGDSVVSGDVRVVGQDPAAKASDVIEFVAQEDVLLGGLTVFETVLFAAKTRLPRDCKEDYLHLIVSDVLRELGLDKIAGHLVGDVERAGISGGQRRRVSLAMALVGNPRVIVLDEPITGLDSASAEIVLRVLRERASIYDCAVLLSIHQPSKSVWGLFDRLVVMGRGGRNVYQGATQEAISFFERFGLRRFEEGANPWEYVLDTLSTNDIDIMHNEFEASSFKPACMAETDKVLELQVKQDDDDDDDSTSKTSSFRGQRLRWVEQVFCLCDRSFRHAARDPSVFIGYILLTAFVALITGWIFRDLDDHLHGAIQRMGFTCVSAMFLWLISLVSIDVFMSEQVMFFRERAAGCYSSNAYFISKLLVDVVPFRVIPSFIYSSIVYFIVGFQPNLISFFWFTLVIVLHNITAGACVFLLSSVCSSIREANMYAVIFFLFNLCYGTTLVHQAPSMAAMLGMLAPFRYSVQALLINEFSNLELIIDPPGMGVVSMTGETWLASLGISTKMFFTNIVVLSIISVVFFVTSLFFLHRQRPRA